MPFSLNPHKQSSGTKSNDIFSLLQTDVNRLFNRFLKDDGFDSSLSLQQKWNPQISLKESKNEFVLKADLPGVEKKDIHVTLDNDILTVKGERKLEEKKDDETHHWNEIFYGFFERSFSVPQNMIDKEKISAEMKNGELRVNLPKLSEVVKNQHKQIEIH